MGWFKTQTLERRDIWLDRRRDAGFASVADYMPLELGLRFEMDIKSPFNYQVYICDSGLRASGQGGAIDGDTP
jgi:hypothetical protein